MILDKENNTTIIYQENIKLVDFVAKLNEVYGKISKDHIIVNLFSFTSLTTDDLLEFLELSNAHRAKRKSFVLVSDKLNFDEIPDEICVVPSVQEARDIIEMEEIERDLDL